jgi:1,2-diacylglycerol 3-alpha-glucosyltransferase
MHIGIFSESYPPIVNGVSTSVLTLMGELERAGHTVSVFTSRAKGSTDYVDEHPRVFRYPSAPSLVEPQYQLPIPFSQRIKAAIPEMGLDLIHSQSPFFLGLIARHVAQELGLPLVSTNHTLYTEYAHYTKRLLPLPLARSMLIGWMQWYYSSCDHVLVPSDLTRQTLLSFGVQAPVTVMPTGIPIPPQEMPPPAAIKRSWDIPQDARLLLYAGRLAPEKNLGMLLEAAAQIIAARPETYLMLAGSGMGDADTRQMVRQMGLEKQTVFTGFLERSRLDPIYAAADVFLFPSKTETQGLAIGEAMACGTPCVVVNAGGAPESVRDGVDGFLVEDDPTQMAERAMRLLDDPNVRQAMSAEARTHAAGVTPDKVAARILGLYENLIATRTRKNQGNFVTEATA